MSNNTTRHGITISESLVLAALPAIAYAIAYRYEVGFCSVYRIPTQHIELTLTAVLSALGALAAGLAATFWIVNLIYMLTSRTAANTPLARANTFSVGMALFLFTIVLVSWPPIHEMLLLAAVFLAIIAAQYIWPLFTQRDKATYSEKLQGQEQIEQHFESLFDMLFHKVGRGQYLVVWVIVVLLFLANAAGKGQARRQRLFLASVADPHVIVLRQYGANYITCRLADDTRTTTTEFRVVSVAGTNVAEAHAFTLLRIGPLVAGDVPSEMPRDPASDVASDTAVK